VSEADDLPVQANLRRIGVRVALRSYAGTIASQLRRRGADVVLARVFPDYQDPVAALRATVGARVDVAALARLGRSERLAASNRLDLELLRRDAPAAAFGTPSIPELFSERVGCKTFQPLFFGVDLASLCLPNASQG
jgi:hypothetical protein